MLDIQSILKNKDIIETAMRNRQVPPPDFAQLETVYKKRIALVQEVDDLNRQKNLAAKERDNTKGTQVKEQLRVTEEKLRVTTQELMQLLVTIPNVPLADVPIGKDESDNVVLRECGDKPAFSFTPKSHWDIGRALGSIDSERGVKVAGSRFTFLKGDIVKLQFAIIQFVLDVVTDTQKLNSIAKGANLSVSTKPFIPVLPPVMVKPDMLFGMARLDPREDKFFLEQDELFLAGSAEHALGAMHADEILDQDDLPLRYIGYSTAFRREAGSYGKDTKGILRQHQFDKMEFESFTAPEDSRNEQDFLVAIQEYLIQQLAMPYRVVAICTGDMGDPDARQIDIEMWMPGQNTYRETHSADLTGAYQSRRLGIRMRPSGGKGQLDYVHMNDATVFAMGRLLIALMENYQQEDGTVTVPEVLQQYTKVRCIR